MAQANQKFKIKVKIYREEGKIASKIFHGSCIACRGDHGGQTRGDR